MRLKRGIRGRWDPARRKTRGSMRVPGGRLRDPRTLRPGAGQSSTAAVVTGRGGGRRVGPVDPTMATRRRDGRAVWVA